MTEHVIHAYDPELDGCDWDALRSEVNSHDLQTIPDGSGSDHGGGHEGWIHGLSMTRVLEIGQLDMHVFADEWCASPGIRYAISRLWVALELGTFRCQRHPTRSNGGPSCELAGGYQGIGQIMVNRLRPGGRLDPHVDAATGLQRWHLPVNTSASASYHDAVNGNITMRAGVWYGPIPFTIEHSVLNRSDAPCPRDHLIVDFIPYPDSTHQ